jgi:hypothetical protein
LELNKQDVVSEIMTRPEFTNRYNGLNNAGYVDAIVITHKASLKISLLTAATERTCPTLSDLTDYERSTLCHSTRAERRHERVYPPFFALLPRTMPTIISSGAIVSTA